METAAAIDQYSQPQSTINNEKQREVARPPPKGAERLLVDTDREIDTDRHQENLNKQFKKKSIQ